VLGKKVLVLLVLSAGLPSLNSCDETMTVVPISNWVPSSRLIRAGLKKMVLGLCECAVTALPWPKADAPWVKSANPEACTFDSAPLPSEIIGASNAASKPFL